MHAKTDLIQIKRVRELNRRLRLIKNRMRNMPIELRFAEGKISKLPDYIPALPKWAIVAARFASDALSKPIKHLKPKPGQKYEVGDLIELMGHLEAMAAYVHNPSKEVRQHEEEVPQLESLRAPVAKQTEKSFRQFLRKVTRGAKIQPVILPPEELIERTRRYYKGLKSFSTDGEIRGFETLSARVYYLIWMFWHEFDGHFTAPYIHTWLKREVDESPSDKLVEAIVTKLRRVARKLRNPKVKMRVIGK